MTCLIALWPMIICVLPWQLFRSLSVAAEGTAHMQHYLIFGLAGDILMFDLQAHFITYLMPVKFGHQTSTSWVIWSKKKSWAHVTFSNGLVTDVVQHRLVEYYVFKRKRCQKLKNQNRKWDSSLVRSSKYCSWTEPYKQNTVKRNNVLQKQRHNE